MLVWEIWTIFTQLHSNNSVPLHFPIPSKVSKPTTDYTHTFLVVVKGMYNGGKIFSMRFKSWRYKVFKRRTSKLLVLYAGM